MVRNQTIRSNQRVGYAHFLVWGEVRSGGIVKVMMMMDGWYSCSPAVSEWVAEEVIGDPCWNGVEQIRSER